MKEINTMDSSDINAKFDKLEEKQESITKHLAHNWDRRSNEQKLEFKEYIVHFDSDINLLSKKIDILRIQGISAWVLMLAFLIGGLQYTMNYVTRNESMSVELLKEVSINQTKISYLIKSIDKLSDKIEKDLNYRQNTRK